MANDSNTHITFKLQDAANPEKKSNFGTDSQAAFNSPNPRNTSHTQQKEGEYICPYCGNSFDKCDVKYLFDYEAYFDKYDIDLKRQNRTDGGYVRFWQTYYGLPENSLSEGDRMVLELTDSEKARIPNSGYSENGTSNENRKVKIDQNTGKVTELRVDMFNSLPIGYCCKFCENYLPDEFFDLPLFRYILAGTASVGKTVYFLSLLRNISKSNGKIRLSENYYYDQNIGDFGRLKRNFELGILPPGTNTVNPPVFFKMEYDGNSYLIWLEDCPGEFFKDGNRSLTRTAGKMNGVFYLVDPKKSKPNGEYPDVDPKYSEEYFSSVVNDENPENISVSDTGITSEDTPDDVFSKLASKLNNRLHNIDCAFVLTQLDKITEDDNEIPFWNILNNNESTSDSSHYKELAAYKLFKKFFPRSKLSSLEGADFKNKNWFAVSAFSGDVQQIGTDRNGRPINKIELQQFDFARNIDEPFQWLLLKSIAESKKTGKK